MNSTLAARSATTLGERLSAAPAGPGLLARLRGRVRAYRAQAALALVDPRLLEDAGIPRPPGVRPEPYRRITTVV